MNFDRAIYFVECCQDIFYVFFGLSLAGVKKFVENVEKFVVCKKYVENVKKKHETK